MFERYTEPARRTIFFARWWALNRKASEIEPSDIILGAAQESRRLSDRLQWMNLDYERMVALFAEGVVPVEKPEAKDLPLSRQSKIALAYAADEVKLDRRYSIEVYHLVRGVLRADSSTAKALSDAGCTLDSLRKGSLQANRDIPDAHLRLKIKTQIQLLRWRAFNKYEWLTAAFVVIAFVGTILYLRSQN